MVKKSIYILLLSVFLLVACQPVPEPTPTQIIEPTDTPTPEPTPTPTEEPEDTPAPEPTPTPTEEPAVFEANVTLELIAEGLTAPLVTKDPDDGSGRLFVVDQIGLIYVIDEEDNLLETPFLDLRNTIVSLNPGYDERGLLGMAFHPDYSNNGRFFVYYSGPLRPEAPGGWNHTSILAEYLVSEDDPNLADPESERVILEVDQPQANHNAGPVLFGPDGYLYLPLGDGGGADDTGPGHVDDWYEVNDGGNAQNFEANMLGSVIRIDIDQGDPYAIPDDNPGIGENFPETWAFGFRNPYRAFFDPGGDNELFLGDAGQILFETAYIVEAGGNYGWNVKEGTDCFSTAQPGNPDAITDCPDEDPDGRPLRDPIIEFNNVRHPDGGLGTTIIGGVVYRGDALPAWDGRYVFGQWSRTSTAPLGDIFVATRPDQGMWDFEIIQIVDRDDGELGEFVLGFGQDSDGEIYLLTSLRSGPSGTTGNVYRILPPPEEDDDQIVEVLMVNNTFEPAEITIEAGTSVIWVNDDPVIHDVVAGTRDDPTGAFQSPDIESGGGFSHTFEEPGTYDYFCSYHPGMDGTVIVE